MPSVADIVAKTLVAYDTKNFFCMMGGDHELWMTLADAGIRLINCRSESGAVYMADGYARAALRHAFADTMKDPDFIKDAQKRRVDVDPVTGDELAALTRQLMEIPAAMVARARKLLAPSGSR